MFTHHPISFSLHSSSRTRSLSGLSSSKCYTEGRTSEGDSAMKFSLASSLVLFLAAGVQAQKYDFVPADFSIHTPTQFLWTDAPLTWLTGINVVGLTNASEFVILPCSPAFPLLPHLNTDMRLQWQTQHAQTAP